MGKDGQRTSDGGSLADYVPDDVDDELYSGSDRAVAVLCQAMIEQTIKDAITNIFHPETKETIHLIGDDERPGVLGFADQCRLAFCLKIISSQIYSDLLLIGKIRNRFGHNPEAISFTTRSIKDRCDELKTFEGVPRLSKGGSSRRISVGRERYMRCIFSIKLSIMAKIRKSHENEIRSSKRREKQIRKRIAKVVALLPSLPVQ